MTNETSYKDLSKLLAEIKKGRAAPVYLLYGDEFLYKSAFKALLDAVVPPNEQTLNYEPLDGATVDMHETVERLNTFGLFPGAKVIAVHGTNVFYSRVTVAELLGRSREAFVKQDLKESARYFVQMLSSAGLSLDDIGEVDRSRLLRKALRDDLQVAKVESGPWLDAVFDYCLGEQITIRTHTDDADVLTEAIIAGFPETNHLVLTAEFVDKRRKLFKTIKTTGVVIDCSVPKGDRAADKRQQKEILRALMRQALRKAGKTMAPSGFEALYEKTGLGIRNFTNELEKLITFVGDRTEILADDIKEASKRTRQDPIYELSNAVGERNTGKALFFVDSLLKANIFPLQILAATINQVRKLVLASDFIRTVYGGGWNADMTYGSFQKKVLPELNDRGSELLTSKAHPYVLYKTFVQCDNYTFEELACALGILLDADIRLKTGGHHAKVVLEHAIMRICGI
jgi:DNA polymerase-3 subunit delta